MSGYILTRDPNEKEWKEGTTIKLDAERPQRVAEADGKSPFLTLLWFEHPRRANTTACWKVSFKSDQLDCYECVSGQCITLVKSFTLVERILVDTQFDGILSVALTGKAIFHHGFLLGTCMPELDRRDGFLSIVYDPKSPNQEGVEVNDLDAYFARHPVASIVGDAHVVHK